MKILLVSSSSGSRGGGELYLLYLGRALAARGHAVTLWASSHPRMDKLAAAFAQFGGVLRREYRNTYDRVARSVASFCDFSAARRIASEWASSDFDLVHINKQNLEDGLDLLRAARLAARPTLATVHLTQSAHFLRAKFAAPRDWIARRALESYPGRLVTVLENRRRDFADFLGDSPRLHTIPNGVPLFDLSLRATARAARRSELGISEDALVVIGVGRMVAQKRPLLFLEHAARVHTQIPSARFVWIGDGAMTADWDRDVATRGLERVVQRLSWQDDVASFLLAADVFLHTAEFEGLPLAILEAISAGLPCAITSNLLGEMPFFDASNSITISDDDSWLHVLDDRVELAARGRAARALAEAEFSFEKMAARYEELYREAIAEAR